MKKLLASKAAQLVGNVLTDILPLGTTVKTNIQTSIEARQWFKLIMWAILGLCIVGSVIGFLVGSITLEELERVIIVLTDLLNK